MHIQAALPFFTAPPASIDGLNKLDCAARERCFNEPARPAPFSGLQSADRVSHKNENRICRQRFVRSVVEAAGLGSFAYLRGESGKRYVFSAVRGHQVSLYSRAVFALAGTDGTLEQIVTRSELSSCPDRATLYVHLLDDDEDVQSVIGDMTAH